MRSNSWSLAPRLSQQVDFDLRARAFPVHGHFPLLMMLLLFLPCLIMPDKYVLEETEATPECRLERSFSLLTYTEPEEDSVSPSEPLFEGGEQSDQTSAAKQGFEYPDMDPKE